MYSSSEESVQMDDVCFRHLCGHSSGHTSYHPVTQEKIKAKCTNCGCESPMKKSNKLTVNWKRLNTKYIDKLVKKVAKMNKVEGDKKSDPGKCHLSCSTPDLSKIDSGNDVKCQKQHHRSSSNSSRRISKDCPLTPSSGYDSDCMSLATCEEEIDLLLHNSPTNSPDLVLEILDSGAEADRDANLGMLSSDGVRYYYPSSSHTKKSSKKASSSTSSSRKKKSNRSIQRAWPGRRDEVNPVDMARHQKKLTKVSNYMEGIIDDLGDQDGRKKKKKRSKSFDENMIKWPPHVQEFQRPKQERYACHSLPRSLVDRDGYLVSLCTLPRSTDTKRRCIKERDTNRQRDDDLASVTSANTVSGSTVWPKKAVTRKINHYTDTESSHSRDDTSKRHSNYSAIKRTENTPPKKPPCKKNHPKSPEHVYETIPGDEHYKLYQLQGIIVPEVPLRSKTGRFLLVPSSMTSKMQSNVYSDSDEGGYCPVALPKDFVSKKKKEVVYTDLAPTTYINSYNNELKAYCDQLSCKSGQKSRNVLYGSLEHSTPEQHPYEPFHHYTVAEVLDSINRFENDDPASSVNNSERSPTRKPRTRSDRAARRLTKTAVDEALRECEQKDYTIVPQRCSSFQNAMDHTTYVSKKTTYC